MKISIHAPQWGATCGRTCRWSPDRHFNPRTPVGCDPTRIGRPTPAGISIHAPQWGATEEQGPAHEGHQISIHAPQWGATSNQLVGISFVFLISIHAPQWGATGRFGNHVEHRTDFNPRTPVGCDWVMVPPVVMLPRFQSTHPSGVRQSFHIPLWAAASFQSTHPSGVRRPTACNACTTAKYFNPRTPVGCDDRGRNHHPNSQISIHAPQWGATDRYADCYTGLQFQSTHPSGVRRPVAPKPPRPRLFQSTHPSGVRPPDWDKPAYTALFQSTHPSGVRRQSPPSGNQEPEISIHAPQWGATTPYLLDKFIQQFQSTHPSGVRRLMAITIRGPILISIHAPQWGATVPGLFRGALRPDFNPRTPVGCDSATTARDRH